jgi:predicted glycoside hydrolase/deacetylase ChbG (UPF0249 family)
MAIKMIINADDMGMSAGVTQGILDSIMYGVVSSTTLMVNMPSASHAAALAVQHKLAVGLHLNVTTGRPLSPCDQVRSLVRPDGSFYSHKEFIRRLLGWQIALHDLYREFSAQVETALRMGLQPTHLDTHHHTHLLLPVASVLMRIGCHYGIAKTRTTRTTDMAMRQLSTAPLLPSSGFKRWYKALVAMRLRRRLRMAAWRMEPSAFRTVTQGTLSSALDEWMFFLQQVQKLPGSVVVEVPCHPAYVDDELRRYATYTEQREEEVKVLTSPELKMALQRSSIQLLSFRDL